MPSVKKIEFDVEGCKVVADLHIPDGEGPFPAVVVGGPMTSVKEQVTGTYAKAVAERGYIGMALDHRHYGESEGEPRQYEFYPHKLADLTAAIDVLGKQAEVDATKLGAFGVCLGSGYIAHAAGTHPAIKALGGIVGYYRDVPAMKSSDPEGFAKKVEAGAEARRAYEEKGELITIPACVKDSSMGDAAMTGEALYAYYGEGGRAAGPWYKNEFAVMSREYFIGFDVQSAAPKMAHPYCMVHCEKGMPPALAKQFYENLPEDKRSEHWVDGPNQTAFYDDPQLVAQCTDIMAAHLDKFVKA
mmetsp:Transcript_52671/g.125850  ORF Transcript_52671/g.125850 Transcript_52671/m.125850 type:complete len:301 (-) Transcript_52671:98-1000(-)